MLDVPNLVEGQLDKRKEKIIKYIIENQFCTRTNVKDAFIDIIGEKTIYKIINESIDEDKVSFYVDENNPQKHHLYVKNSSFLAIFQAKMKMKDLLLSKVENQIYTTAELVGGDWKAGLVYQSQQQLENSKFLAI